MSTRSREHPKHRDRTGRYRRTSLPLDLVPGVPRKVSIALGALDEPELTAFKIRNAIRHYADVTSMSRERFEVPPGP